MQTKTAQQVFQTNNMALAVALFTAGVPIPDNDKGKPVPGHNIYDADILRALGFRGKPIEQAAREAFKEGQGTHGIVVYNFVSCDLLHKVIEGFDEQAKAITESDSKNGSVGHEEITEIQVSPEDVGRIACQCAKNRKLYQGLWRKLVPEIAVHGAQSTSIDSQGRKIVKSSFKQIQLGASEETKRKVGL